MSGSASITVLTPTLPERSGMLKECQRSVKEQTVEVEHLIHIDTEKQGPQISRNKLAEQAKTEWVFPLDDDDTLDSDCVEVLLDQAGDADIVYPWCRMEG